MARYAIYLCGPDEPLTLPGGGCSNAAEHTPAPAGYTAWHEWAARMSRTHTSTRCPACGLYRIWKPKGSTG